ncbi:FEN-1 [Carcinus maenas nudivirus]|uniref:FEN-1 n=1 Tax=Carcinus maenas nudivirus TaxID=2880837 RepID=A0AAE9BZA9_9VIRU|nr:FEN-1 [Carcinus maenas nudivirus]UBZ25603.1 FEN-1 [Carcinus maenas nudivirus]
MGITEFRKLKDEFIQQCSVSDLKYCGDRKTKVIVHVDGSFYLYCGYISQNLNADGTAFYPSKVADTACTLLYNTIKKIEKYKDIYEVHIFFDGLRPSSKKKTMELRKLKKGPKKNIIEVTNCMVKILNDHNYIMNNLVIGESEHEMMIHRNPNYPTILLSDDSDLFHISFGYNSVTFNDFIFIASKSLNSLYNVTDIHNTHLNKMPKLAFSLLCFLKGSDFTHNLFTTTMANAIISAYTSKENNFEVKKILNEIQRKLDTFKLKERQINETVRKSKALIYNQFDERPIETIEGIYSTADVCWLIKEFLKILILSKTSFLWNRQKIATKSTTIKADISAQIEALTWSVNYSLIGCKYNRYFDYIEFPSNLNCFSFYYYILEMDFNNIYDKMNTLNLNDIDKQQFICLLKSQRKYGV